MVCPCIIIHLGVQTFYNVIGRVFMVGAIAKVNFIGSSVKIRIIVGSADEITICCSLS